MPKHNSRAPRQCTEDSMVCSSSLQSTVQSDVDDKVLYCTPRQLAEDRSLCFSLAMIRYYILHSHSNGLEPCLRRLGRKILIRKDLFLKWLESHSRGGRK